MQTPEHDIRQALGAHTPGEPHEGHEQRFEQRLNRLKGRREIRRIPSWVYLTVAAASLAGLIITLVVSEIRKTNEQYSRMKLSDLSYEMARVEAFYQKRLHDHIPVFSNQDEMLIRLGRQLKELETGYASLEAALAQSPANQQVVEAMVENYRYRLQIVEMMQRYIEISNQVKEKQNEGTDL
jgi:hypothetical protein